MNKPTYTTNFTPKEVVDFFREKGYKIGFDYRDVWKEEHAIAFTVAKATSIDLLQDIRNSIDKAISEGWSYQKFEKDFRSVCQKNGWWGEKKMVDPVTGEEKIITAGTPRRAKTILRTNRNAAYQAGAWQRIEDAAKAFPALQYKVGPSKEHREDHLQWKDRIFAWDDPFWDSWYPKNGHGCECWVRQISKREIDSGSVVVSPSPKFEYVNYKNKRTGEVSRVPKGITPGFDFNVGKARMKAFTPPPLGNIPSTFQDRKTELPAIPYPSPLPNKYLLKENLSNEEYSAAFLGEFGVKKGKNLYFKDVIGDIMPINEGLFTGSVTGYNKINKNGRGKYVKLLAMSIKDPDEIWLRWEKDHLDKWTLKKRYIKIWEEKDGSHCLSVFDKSSDGWNGVTTFPAKQAKSMKARDEYINQYRDGFLLYKK
ncbi:MAG: PBECR2 nuclease fold domain-containing protein [Alphaproteobacteria bacterium]